MSGWLGQHRDALASASQRFGRAPLASAFTVLVIAIGSATVPDSSIHTHPVISPLPFSE